MIKNKLNIPSTPAGNIKDQRRSFRLPYPHKGSAEVVLTTYGAYQLNVNSYSASENQVKRTLEYKNAISDVSNDMATAFDKEQDAYCHLEKKAVKIKAKEVYEAEVNNMRPQSYTRKAFGISKPEQKEIRELLAQEANSVFFGQKIDTKAIDKYVNSKCEVAYADRYKAWEAAKQLFDEIENAQAAKTNNEYQIQFDALHARKQEFIAGDEQTVSDALDELEGIIVSPYKLGVDTTYNQEKGELDVEARIPQNLMISTDKVNILQSGKVSIKAKLVKEQEQDKTDALLGVSFFLSSYLFDVSPNIRYINFMLTDAVRQNAYYWVRFERKAFSLSTQGGKIFPPVDIFQYENILTMSDVRGALTIQTTPLPDMRADAKARLALIQSGI